MLGLLLLPLPVTRLSLQKVGGRLGSLLKEVSASLREGRPILLLPMELQGARFVRHTRPTKGTQGVWVSVLDEPSALLTSLLGFLGRGGAGMIDIHDL